MSHPSNIPNQVNQIENQHNKPKIELINNINKTQKEHIDICRSNLEILLSQNDILPLLKNWNHICKTSGKKLSLSEYVHQKNVSK